MVSRAKKLQKEELVKRNREAIDLIARRTLSIFDFYDGNTYMVSYLDPRGEYRINIYLSTLTVGLQRENRERVDYFRRKNLGFIERLMSDPGKYDIF
jgi:hypothetical protein